MKPMKNLLLMGLLSALGAGGALAAERSHFTHFITRDGAALKDGDKVFRFAGIHAPELHRIEDDARGPCRADPRGWGQYFKWPTAQEQQNWIQAMVQTGAKAQRVYVLSVQQEFDKACGRETHILAPETAPGHHAATSYFDAAAVAAWANRSPYSSALRMSGCCWVSVDADDVGAAACRAARASATSRSVSVLTWR